MLLKRLTVHFGLDENVKSSRQIAYTEWGDQIIHTLSSVFMD